MWFQNLSDYPLHFQLDLTQRCHCTDSQCELRTHDKKEKQKPEVAESIQEDELIEITREIRSKKVSQIYMARIDTGIMGNMYYYRNTTIII